MSEREIPAVPPVDAPTDSSLDLASAVMVHGGRLEQLADGSVIVTIAGEGPVTDQAARGARCALALRRLAPVAPMAMVIGRGQLDGRYPVGEVIERGVRLMRATAPDDRTGELPPAGRSVRDGEESADGDGGRKGDGMAPIRIDEQTAGLLDGRFDVGLVPAPRSGEPDGLALRGELEIVSPTRTLLGRVTPCVGRDRELSILLGVYQQCLDEPLAQVALVTGKPGVGKSRLMQEFLRTVEQGHGRAEVWIARGDPLHAGAPFGLLGAALRRAMGILDGEQPALRRRK